MKHLKLFEDFESGEEVVKSKSQLRRELWHKNNPSPTGKIYQSDELSQFGISDSIIKMMKDWPIIYKSPYSKSFYSSDDISWESKPDKSYRVSDHWNFETNRGPKLHCQTTEPVKNNTHYSIGQFDEKIGKYKILLSELTTIQDKKIKDQEQKLKYLKDPEVIYRKKLFKDSIRNGEVFVQFTIDGQEYKGLIDKYSGYGGDIRLKNDKGETIYTNNYFRPQEFKLLDKNGEQIQDPL
jgi:hypothetical protein